MADEKHPTGEEHEEPVELELDPEEALRGLSNADPDHPVPQDEPLKDQGDALS